MIRTKRVMVVGEGGREHALAKALAASNEVSSVLVAPGNGGTIGGKLRRVGCDLSPEGILRLAQTEGVDLTVIGPEGPLVAGVVDRFEAAGLACFGPTAAAARLESSKAWAKRFMQRTSIPTAPFEVFNSRGVALQFVQDVSRPIVIKVSGLAGGKGVTLPKDTDEGLQTLRTIFEGAFGEAGEEVVVEQRLEGHEASLMVLCDTKTALPLLPVRDYKRLLDGDRGPNTGGMGSAAPDPMFTPALRDKAMAEIVEPTLRAMREQEKTPFRGLLYVGLMVLGDDLRVLEYNVRFGDPETQALLPLLETDLFALLWAATEGRLAEQKLSWKKGASVTVVAASGGYPFDVQGGKPITGIEDALTLPGLTHMGASVDINHAGTKMGTAGQFVTAGGRVLSVNAQAKDLARARTVAYLALDQVRFQGLYARRDIAQTLPNDPVWEAVEAIPYVAPPPEKPRYATAGVDIKVAAKVVDHIRAEVESTHGPEVLGHYGGFGGIYDVTALKGLDRPVLVTSTDGVGTKVLVARTLGKFEGLGRDLVNHCINDILAQGALPIFFTDYIGMARLDSREITAIVKGCAAACRDAHCALIGGEMAEMPGVYSERGLDVVGSIVGVTDLAGLIDGSRVAPGDGIVALPSSGLHTNGFTLARSALAALPWDAPCDELDGAVLGDVLLAVHRSYLNDLQTLREAGVDIVGLVHVTGGGLVHNLPRILAPTLTARIELASWSVPPIFQLIQELGDVGRLEMFEVFNMGAGMLVITRMDAVDTCLAAVPGAWRIGEVVKRTDNPVVFT